MSGSALLQRFWDGLKARESEFAAFVPPTTTTFASLILTVACVTVPIGLVLQVVGVEGALLVGLGVAIPMAFVLAIVAKVQGVRGRDREDKWRPSR